MQIIRQCFLGFFPQFFLAIIVLSVLSTVGSVGRWVPFVYAETPMKENLAETTIELVQSIPAETSLAVPGVALTTDVWISMIRRAQSTLDLAQFYLSNDRPKPAEGKETSKDSGKDLGEKKPLEPVLLELEKAAKRGVRIRLLLSSSLTQEDPQTIERMKRMRGAEVRILDLSETTGGVHHAKYWIIDRREIFVGSQNFDWRSLTQIHELGVRIQDTQLARQLGRIFEADWRLSKNREDFSLGYYNSPSSSPLKVELVASPGLINPSDTRPTIQAVLELITNAKKSLQIQLMEYAPLASNQTYWPELDNALRAAALRGVKVQILLANCLSTVKTIEYVKSLAELPAMEVKWVTIPPYSGGAIPYARLIHSKYMVVDDETLWLGTSNWSKGYFYNSRNVDLVIRRLDLAKSASQIFQTVWGSNYASFVKGL
jgi:phosphatidylserine/phosphatidylglycerophosphate/cardiolipin synthase-like enzyme